MAGLTNIGDAVAATLRSVEDAREYTRQREERELEEKFRKEHEARMAAQPQTEEEKAKAEEAALLKQNIIMLNKGIETAKAAMRKEAVLNAQLEIESVFQAHAKTLLWIANNVVLAHQRRKFVVDENNRDILRFYSTTSTDAQRPRRFSQQRLQAAQTHYAHGRGWHRQNSPHADIFRVSALHQQPTSLLQSLRNADGELLHAAQQP